MKIALGELRRIIRRALQEGPAGPGVAANPTDVKGFYPYEIDRGADIHGYWYLSPGDKGSNDPMRPDDPNEYIGLKTRDSVVPETSDEETK